MPGTNYEQSRLHRQYIGKQRTSPSLTGAKMLSDIITLNCLLLVNIRIIRSKTTIAWQKNRPVTHVVVPKLQTLQSSSQ